MGRKREDHIYTYVKDIFPGSLSGITVKCLLRDNSFFIVFFSGDLYRVSTPFLYN